MLKPRDGPRSVAGAALLELNNQQLLILHFAVSEEHSGLGLGTYFVNCLKEYALLKRALFLSVCPAQGSLNFWREDNDFLTFSSLQASALSGHQNEEEEMLVFPVSADYHSLLPRVRFRFQKALAIMRGAKLMDLLGDESAVSRK